MNATAGNQSAQLSFQIPQTNGNPVTTVNWQDSEGGLGTFPVTPASTGAAETETVTPLSNGASYTFTLEACNADYGCGPPSLSSNSVVPYGPPNTPSAGATANGTSSITFSWSGGGGNGRPIANYQVNIDGGGWQNEGPNPGSTSKSSYGPGMQGCIQVRVVDTVGQQSGTASQCATTAQLSSTVYVSEGGSVSSSFCKSNCHYVNVSLNNFAPNTKYAIYLYCDKAGYCNGTTSDFAPYDPEYVTTDGSGNASFDNFWEYGYANSHVWAVVSGHSSGLVLWH